MYQSGTRLQSILWTVVCSQDFLTICWLSAGYRLAIGWPQPKINTLQDSHILLCTQVAHGCNQYLGLQCVHEIFWLSAGYILAGYWLAMARKQYTSRHSHTTMYPSCIWLQAILWTVVCSQDYLGGYGPKSMHFKTGIHYYVPKLHMAASNTLDCSVFAIELGLTD